MEQLLNDAFSVLSKGLAAVNAAKASESGTGTGVTSVAKPVVATAGAIPWKLIGGLAIGGLVLYMVMKRK